MGAEVLSRRPRFRGGHARREIRAYARMLAGAGLTLGVCDWGYCVYRRESSACLGDDRAPNPVLRTQSTCAGCANFAVTEKNRPVWAARRRRNADLLLHPALDPESQALAAARVEECDGILADLDQNRTQHGA